MGQDRALALQNAAEHFIRQKDEKDAIAVIKYDGTSTVETPLTTVEEELVSNIKHNGLHGFGGSTALLDAINRGISTLKNAHEYKRLSVVVLTDGHENSSMISNLVPSIRNLRATFSTSK